MIAWKEQWSVTSDVLDSLACWIGCFPTPFVSLIEAEHRVMLRVTWKDAFGSVGRCNWAQARWLN